MKKITIILLTFCLFIFSSKADLIVDADGIAHIENAVIGKIDTDTISILGDNLSFTGPYLKGPSYDVFLLSGSHYKERACTTLPNTLSAIYNNYSFSVGSNGNTAYFYSSKTNTESAVISTDALVPQAPVFIGKYYNATQYTSMIRADGAFITKHSFITASDRNLKENITTISNALENISEMRPVSYNFIDNNTSRSGNATTTDDENNRPKYGFIAQEVEEIFPNVVYTMPGGDKGIAYQEIIPILVSAIQEQQAEIEALNEEIAELKDETPVGRQQAPAGMQESIAQGETVLMQNTPNPFNQATEIGYRLADGTATAMILLCDMNGKLLQTYPLPVNSTNGTLTIQAGSYAPGMYLYTLLVDGVQIDTKQMIILAH